MHEARFLLAWRTASSSSVSSHKLSSIFDPTTRNRSPLSVFLPTEVMTVSHFPLERLITNSHVLAEPKVSIIANIEAYFWKRL